MSAAEMLKWQYPGIVVDVGGTGIDLHKGIPEIDLIRPDYSLYPENKRSMGFTSRGCNRRCSFCVVPKKEGKFKVVQHPSEFHNSEFKEIMFLDNNILFDKEWFMEVTDWILENNLTADFNQGLDIRLIDSDIAQRLHEIHNYTSWKFAFDSIDYKDDVLDGIKILQDAKIHVRNNLLFYVYIDSDENFDDALERCNILREAGASSFLMVNMDTQRTQRMTDLKCWCRPRCYWKIPFSEFDRSVT